MGGKGKRKGRKKYLHPLLLYFLDQFPGVLCMGRRHIVKRLKELLVSRGGGREGGREGRKEEGGREGRREGRREGGRGGGGGGGGGDERLRTRQYRFTGCLQVKGVLICSSISHIIHPLERQNLGEGWAVKGRQRKKKN